MISTRVLSAAWRAAHCAFATWRMAVVLQQLHNRYVSGDSVDTRLADVGHHIHLFAERAAELLLG